MCCKRLRYNLSENPWGPCQHWEVSQGPGFCGMLRCPSEMKDNLVFLNHLPQKKRYDSKWASLNFRCNTYIICCVTLPYFLGIPKAGSFSMSQSKKGVCMRHRTSYSYTWGIMSQKSQMSVVDPVEPASTLD